MGSTSADEPTGPQSAPSSSHASSADRQGTRIERICRLAAQKRGHLSAGAWHSCVIDAQSRPWCWGGNAYGAVGNGKHGWRGRSEDEVEEDGVARQPTLVSFDRKMTSVAAGGLSTCGIEAEGTLWCWGAHENNESLDGLADIPRIRSVGGRVRALALGTNHHCAIRDDKTLWCRGDNRIGQIEPSAKRTTLKQAVQIESLGKTVESVALSNDATCVLKDDHSVWCWGGNRNGELGIGEPGNRLNPAQVFPPGAGVVEVAGGSDHFCARFEKSGISCWGWDYHGQLGDESEPKIGMSNAPLPVKKRIDAIQLSLGNSFSGALDSSGTIWLWGSNSSRVMGDTHPKGSVSPVKVQGLCPAVQFSAGGSHVCAICEDQSVWCWGAGRDCQLGDGKCTDYAPAPERAAFPNP
ncbi:MAG: RCC1 domain-containing protein [Myxococcales bacterium]